MASTTLRQPAIRKRRSEPSFGIDVVKNKKLLKYKDMQILAETSFSTEQNSPVSTVNENNVFSCSICSEKYETLSLLNIHQWDHTPPSKVLDIKVFTCIQCNKNYSVLTCFVHHMKNHHNNIHFCKYCSLSFDSFAAMKCHVKETHTSDMLLKGKESARFMCVFCPASYYSAKHLISHLRKYHSKQITLDKYYPKCMMSDINDGYRKHEEHKIISGDKKSCKRTPLKCLATTAEMHIPPSESDRKVKAKSTPKYNCNHCNIKFLSSISLQKHHRRCHKIDKIFKPTFGCAKCSAKFFKSNFLRKHLINHHGTSATPKV